MKNEKTKNRCPQCGEEFDVTELRYVCGHEIKEESSKWIVGLKAIYVLVLAGGGLLALLELARTVNLYNAEPMANTMERGGSSLSVLVITVAYTVILRRKGFSLLSLPLYCFCYVLVGITMAYWLRLSAKGFAPDGPNDLFTDYMHMALFIAAALGISVACLWIVGRSGRRSHNQEAAHKRGEGRP